MNCFLLEIKHVYNYCRIRSLAFSVLISQDLVPLQQNSTALRKESNSDFQHSYGELQKYRQI